MPVLSISVAPGDELPLSVELDVEDGVPPYSYDVQWFEFSDPDITFYHVSPSEIRITIGEEVEDGHYNGIIRGIATDTRDRSSSDDLILDITVETPLPQRWSSDLIETTGNQSPTTAGPNNIYFRRRLFISSYSSEEVEAAIGMTEATIVGVRFFTVQAPLNQPLPNYSVGLKATTLLLSENPSGTAGGAWSLVRAPASETFTADTFQEFIFDTPFEWEQGFNLSVAFAWGQCPVNWDASGSVPIGSGISFYAQTDSAGAYSISDITTVTVNHRPVIQLWYETGL